jgi:hypothetical protein
LLHQRHGDVLRMQRLARPHDKNAEPVLESDSMRAIAHFVARDAAEVGRPL